MLLEFAAANDGGGQQGGSGPQGGGGAPAGQRTYNWRDKVTIALSVSELGALFADPSKPHSFFHDPGMGTGAQGATTKSLKVNPADDGGLYFNASQQQQGRPSASVSVRLSDAEFYVLRRLGDYAIPRLLGVDYVFSTT